jgi:DNA helicase-2/ATP-dependent DNA helicase PcrA
VKQIELGLEVEEDLRRHRGALGRPDPWVGRYQVETEDGLVTVRVGHRQEKDHNIVDWRDAASMPLFDAQMGDHVAVKVGGAEVTGRLTSRARVDAGPDRDHQVELFAGQAPVRPAIRRRRAGPPGLPDILGLLTPEQYRLITATRDRPVVVQGRAGSGKTTAALYRVAWLAYPSDDEGGPPLDPARVLVVMFNRALSAYVSSLLEPLGLQQARIDTFHGWALGIIQRACGPHAVFTEPHEGREPAARVKRHPGILDAIDAFVAHQRERSEVWLEPHLRAYGALDLFERLHESSGPPVPALVRVLQEARGERDRTQGSEHARLEQVVKVLERALHRLTRYVGDLEALLTDRSLLHTYVPDVPPWEVDSAARFQAFLHKEPRLTFDDFALLVRLMQTKNGGHPDPEHPGRVAPFEHVVVDEAQDFGAVELDVLFRTVRSPGDVTIVGDLNQKIVPDAAFIGWAQVARRLGLDGAAVAQLEVGHRCNQPIMSLAHDVIGIPPPSQGKQGPLPTLERLQDEAELLDTLHDRLVRRWQEQPRSHLCVVCRQRDQAKILFDALRPRLEGTLDVRWGHNKSFVFEPGVTVTNVRQLKGLEFDTVVVVEPDEEAYPATDESRRLLYTVFTRAQERLVLLGRNPWTPLLQPSVDAGRLRVADSGAVQPIEFGPDDDAPF